MNYFVFTACNEFADPNANLKGCCNDARAAFELCRDDFNTVGWDGELLFNRRNTAKAARTTIQQVIDAASPGDCIWIHNSSHGTIVPINGKSEHCNVPYDFDWNDLNTFVSGSQYQAMFRSAKPGVKIYFTTDSCNSGGMIGRAITNGLRNGTVRKNKFLHPPLDLELKLSMCVKANPKGLIGDLTDVWFISGCGPSATDYSADVTDPQTGQSYGAFSHYLFPLLKANKGKPKLEICSMVDSVLAQDQFDQRPMPGGSNLGSFLNQ
jgi:hypothetical protein